MSWANKRPADWKNNPLAGHSNFEMGASAMLEAALKDLMVIVNEQSNDVGLWFVKATASEAYLQQELRKLHAAIESVAAPATVPEE